ncbi:DUF5107 domain-containing protein [Echinicola shivajiensis]|uniref:DUF5107 domain-containing protein n=1 Tax=Echinicola shivajiensis TaxID=1035916 RepID=UPI001BFC46AD|nr:DUF5107 domain-containing protein [Echinicola shivajiensis]
MVKYWLVFILTLSVNLVYGQSNVSSKEYYKDYLTYSFSDPDPIPAQVKLYPYFRFDGFTDNGKVQQWKVVELENDFIKVQIMPEIGGKVWTAYDKIHQKHFLYNNEVVKFRDIAMRGPWVSGGIEANYGTIGHTPNSATPVDYLVRNNEDGSVSCFTSTLDLLTRTRWVLEIKLEKDKAYFTTQSYWFNATGTEQPYYTWMNAGIPEGDDMKFLYPGNSYIGHGGEAKKWPIDDEGRNLSNYSENKFGGSKSFHVLGTHSNYFGALWEKDDFGMIRYSRRGDKLGKKIFLWAQSEQGQIWEDLLTDNSGQYVEIQSGRLFNQNVFSSSLTPFKQIGFAPYSDEQWTEYWYPFGGLEGFTHANLTGAFKIEVKGQEVSFNMSPAQCIEDSLNVYNQEEKVILSKYINAKPLNELSYTMTLPEGESPLFIELEGSRIYIKESDDKNLSRPLEISPGFDAESAYGLYLQGRDLYRFRNYQTAEEKIIGSLSKDGEFIPALVEMAKLKYYRMQYDSAFYYSKKALSIDTYDGEANYYYGLAAEQLSKDFDAMDGFEVASLSPEFRNASYTALSKIYLQRSELMKAEDYANLALGISPGNLEALHLLYVLARLKGEQEQLYDLEARIKELNPIDHFLRFEKFYQSKSDERKADFVNLIRNEFPIESFLELAIWYSNIGRLEESVEVLQLAPNNAESLYWLAWLTRGTPQSSAYLDQVEQISMNFVFPFREESAEILEWATSVRSSWKSGYLLALINEFRGNREKASSLVKGGYGVDFAPYYIFKARIEDDIPVEKKIDYVEKAVALQPKEWRFQRILGQLYLQAGNITKASEILERAYKADKSNYMVGMDLIKVLMMGDQYKEAEKLLSSIKVLPFEGATDAKKFYRQTKLMLAYKAMEEGAFSKALDKIEESEEWPWNLGVGKPYPELIDNQLERSLKVMVYKRMGSLDKHLQESEIDKDIILDRETLRAEIEAISFRKDERMF